MPSEKPVDANREYSLLILQEGKTQKSLVRVLMLILNYRYGLDLMPADSFFKGFSAVQKHGRRIRCAVVVQDRKIDSRTSIASLSEEGSIPIFLVLPRYLIESHQELCGRLDNVHFCAWEDALSNSESSLSSTIERVFAERGIGDLFGAATDGLPHAELQEQVETRLAHLKTLPTLPQVALRIMAIINDPDSSAEVLQEVLSSDPAIVHKLLQLVNSPLFAGSGHKGGWSLQEAIVRLGRRKVGSIAQQINLMTHLVKPAESHFDMQRFWEHSVGCAVIADRLCRDNLVRLEAPLEFNDYWVGALLHDSGMLVLGFFFWDHFEELLGKMDELGCTFRHAERDLCDVANHEFLGRLLLLKSSVREQLVDAVGAHHTTGSSPSDLTCILHLASNLANDLGKAYLPFEPTVYSAEVLEKLGMQTGDVKRLQESLGSKVVDEIELLVSHCTQSP